MVDAQTQSPNRNAETTITQPRVSVQVEPLLLRKPDAARVLSVSPRVFDDLVLAGLIGKVRIGGVVAFDLEELRTFVRQAKRDPEMVRAPLEKLRAETKARRARKFSPCDDLASTLSATNEPL